ncbi:hypothetical protein GIB67_010429 [Kingdonia uniflora]|uniref:F-box/LRR-repeat protein 15-like leucin rich repeat domain-containing protein n=1 Tax=Kingdonia uniflora TaxID=39325 RepID=A0A7J7MAD9_9MAGN|nr:hypothetical protein GIB67_010429 [Kingdonia uniflora]
MEAFIEHLLIFYDVDNCWVFQCVEALQSLEVLNLNGCQKISDNGIEAVTSVCPNLKTFSIYWNMSILLDWCSSYVRLEQERLVILIGDLTLCSSGILNMAMDGTKIYESNFDQTIFNITDESLYIIADSYQNMETLNLTRCIKLTDNGLEQIMLKCSYLQSLNLYALSRSNMGYYQFLNLSRSLFQLELGFLILTPLVFYKRGGLASIKREADRGGGVIASLTGAATPNGTLIGTVREREPVCKETITIEERGARGVGDGHKRGEGTLVVAGLGFSPKTLMEIKFRVLITIVQDKGESVPMRVVATYAFDYSQKLTTFNSGGPTNHVIHQLRIRPFGESAGEPIEQITPLAVATNHRTTQQWIQETRMNHKMQVGIIQQFHSLMLQFVASKCLIRIREMMARYEELCDPFWEGFVSGFEERTTVISQFFILDVNGRRDVGDGIVPPLLSTMTGYGKFRGRLQDFQKSFTVQILCTFYGMKTKRLKCTLHTCVSPLEHRPLDFVDKIFSDEGLSFVGEVQYGLLAVSQFSFTDDAYKKIELLTHLRFLDLCGSQNLSDEGLSCIAKCKNLVSLNLTWCVRVTDVGVMVISHGCTSLEFLSLFGIVGVSDEALQSLSRSCSSTLTTLDVNGCIRIKGRSRDELLRLFPRLVCFKVHS